MTAGLYIHVPFCVRKCRYCDFFSVRAADHEPAVFLDALKVELQQLPDDFAPRTIYIGGGTPTAMGIRDLARLLELVADAVETGCITEWTCEANPGTINAEKVNLLRRYGVNRVSLGVQSLNSDNLKFLGRIHSSAEARAAYTLLRGQNVENINLDLMYGIPQSSQQILEQDLNSIIRLGPEHVSCYCLSFENGTPLTKKRDAGEIREVEDEEEYAQYSLILKTLTTAGYKHYELSNFARPGKECRHNMLYWGPGEYIGCGPAAHSHWGGARYGNVRNLNSYCTALFEGRSPREFEERLEPEAHARELLVMGLRRIDGVSRSEFKSATGFDYRDLRGPEIDKLCADGLVIETGQSLKLTEKALFISNTVFAELV